MKELDINTTSAVSGGFNFSFSQLNEKFKKLQKTINEANDIPGEYVALAAGAAAGLGVFFGKLTGGVPGDDSYLKMGVRIICATVVLVVPMGILSLGSQQPKLKLAASDNKEANKEL